MDRSLRLDDLLDALGTHQRRLRPPDVPDDIGEEPDLEEDWLDTGPQEPVLPTAEELQDLLAGTEVRLFLNQRDIPDSLLRTGWFLHGVASADTAFERYTAVRQRRAFAISAHIFDLATLSPDRHHIERLRWAFAAQVGYHRSEGEPNAIAVGRRFHDLISADRPLLDHFPTLALEAGVALLALDVRLLRPLVLAWQDQLRQLAAATGVEDLAETMFGPTYCVVEGVAAVARFVATGGAELLDVARQLFDAAVHTPAGDGDHDGRWVAAHLRFLADEMAAGSIWNLLPPDLPAAAKQAFTLIPPYVMTLWRPQRELLAGSTGSASGGPPAEAGPSALDPIVRRIVLSVPTSAGKTLMAQLIITSHLAARPSGGVCYVAPQRSLGREVRRDLGRRLRVLAREVSGEEPDFPIAADGELAALLNDLGLDPASVEIFSAPARSNDPNVAIMTPERLAHALREDAEGVLSRYDLFVFDEAHLIQEKSRGFLLESTLAFLHWRTRDTAHRIVLLSAAMGNAGQLAQWLEVDQPPRLLESDWRGPRRLHAIFNTDIDWNTPTSTTVKARGQTAHLPQRLSYDTYGVIRLRPAEHHVQSVRTTDPIGVTCFRATADGTRQDSPEAGQGTPLYRMVAQIVCYVGHAGPVLVIQSTRDRAVSTATAIAEELPERETAAALANFARLRLGDEHPLPTLLSRGVAYHHAGLPVDLQDAIEEAIRSDVLTYIVATTTLTDGVNLPVRTVVIAAVPYPNQPPEQELTGARLINALGRAGRATKESEGWVILTRAAKPKQADFALLEPTATQLEVRSRLDSQEALDALAAFEDAIRAGEDALIAAAAELTDFIAFIWFILAAEDEAGRAPTEAAPLAAFTATLAYAQLTPENRTRYEAVVSQVQAIYEHTDPNRRRRWAKTRTSITSARVLDEIADSLTELIHGLSNNEADEIARDPLRALAVLEQLGVLQRLLQLPERPKPWVFRKTRSGRSQEVGVEPAALLSNWILGVSLTEMADQLLAGIPDRQYRLERMVDTVTDFCEHYLSWMLSALLALINSRLVDTDRRLAPDLPLFVRYGVNSAAALRLLFAGIKARETANRIAAAAREDGVSTRDLVSWLANMSIEQWRSRFAASATDVADLLEFCRDTSAGLLRTLLTDGQVMVNVQETAGPSVPAIGQDRTAGATVVALQYASGEPPPARLGLYSEGGGHTPLATIPVPLHLEIEAVLDAGLPIEISLIGGEITIRLEGSH